MTRADIALRELLVIRMKATAQLQMQMATVLTGKGQNELRAHLIDSASLLIEAGKELSA